MHACARARALSFSRMISTWSSRSREINSSRIVRGRATARTPRREKQARRRTGRTGARAASLFFHARASLRGGHVWASGGHTTAHDGDGARGPRDSVDSRKDTCCTVRWVAVSGLCDSLSSVKICLSPSSCGCHAIFIVFFNSTTVTRSLPSLTSQINGSSLQRSLTLSFYPLYRESSARTVVAQGGATPFLRARGAQKDARLSVSRGNEDPWKSVGIPCRDPDFSGVFPRRPA